VDKCWDIVIIGGGINGCSIAYYLRELGIKKILIIEKGHIASGPTGRSSGVVRQHYSHETLAAMARDSVKVWQNFKEEIGGDAGYVRCGAVFFVSEKDVDSFREAVAMHQRIGVRETLLSKSEMKEMEPRLFVDDISWGAYEPDGGYADPALAANSFWEAAHRKGVELLKKTEVVGLKVEAGRIKGVVTDKEEISTRIVINVAGPWGKKVAAMAGVPIPLRASRHPVVILQRPFSWRQPTPYWGDLVNGWYFKPERNEGVMVGSIHDIEGETDMENYSTVPSYLETEEYSAAILKRFPVMEEGAAQGGWAGLYDITPDWQPIIDRIAGVEGFYCAVGFSGHGFKIAPSVGRIMSELVVDGYCKSYDVHMFRHARFEQRDLSRSTYSFGIIG
jgi:sarcosine oxidase subunit beta